MPYPGATLSQACTNVPGIYHVIDWKYLSQPPPSQPLYYLLKIFWDLKWHPHDNWSHHIWVITTTQINNISSSENLEGHRCRVTYIEDRIFKTKATLLTFVFLIPGATTLTTFSQVLSPMYYALFVITQYPSVNLHIVTKLALLSQGCTKSLFARNITGLYTPAALPTQRTVSNFNCFHGGAYLFTQ